MAARVHDLLRITLHTTTGATMANDWTANQYRVFRFLLGVYLVIHLAQLLPWAGEVFSSAGMLANAAQNPLFGIVPNVLSLVDSPQFVMGLVAAATIAAGFHIRILRQARGF